MDANLIAGQPQCAGNLVCIFRHLNRGPDIENLFPDIPFGNNAKGFDWHGRIASPDDGKAQLMIGLCKIIINRPPDKLFIQQHIRLMVLVDWRAVCPKCLFRIQHKWQGGCLQTDFFGCIFGNRPAFGNHSTYPFTSIAHLSNGKRIAPHIRGVQTIHQRANRSSQFGAGHNINDAGHRQCGAGVNIINGCGRQMTGQQCNMRHIGMVIIGNIPTFANNKAAVFNNPARLRQEFVFFIAHPNSVLFHAPSAGWLRPCSRSAASMMASTICT